MRPKITPLGDGAFLIEASQEPQSFSNRNAQKLREISNDPDYKSEELFKGKSNGHKFKEGQEATLTGLVDFPEFNGTKVKITSIREDGPRGKAYYIEGDISKFVNWVYEYRLE